MAFEDVSGRLTEVVETTTPVALRRSPPPPEEVLRADWAP